MPRWWKNQRVDVDRVDVEDANKWVQLMASLPADTNPLLDDTGQFAELGDTGDIHYLAGNFGGETTREFDVDHGDTLIVPLLNVWSDEFTNSLPDLRDDVYAFLDSLDPTSIFLRIDLDSDGTYERTYEYDISNVNYFRFTDEGDPIGVPKHIKHKGDAAGARKFFVDPDEEDSLVFDFPADGIFGDPFPATGGSSESYTTGYFAQIDDLPLGTHTIEFGGSILDGAFEIAVTDIVTVVDYDFTVSGIDVETANGWVQTMAAIPADQNPILDETGEFAHLGNVGDVHYLAGNFGGETTRAFDVEADDALIVPMLNVWSDEFTASLPDLREDALAFLDSIDPTSIFLRIDINNDGGYEYNEEYDLSGVKYFKYDKDGDPKKAFNNVKHKGPAKDAKEFFVNPKEDDKFEFEFPEDGIFGDPFPPEGGTSESYTTGYYAQIQDLPLGTHRIEFGGSILDGGFEIAVTDIVTVVEDLV